MVDMSSEGIFSSRLISLYHQYKNFMTQENYDTNQFLTCKIILGNLEAILNKGTFTGNDLVSLLEILIASDILQEEPKTKDDRYFKLCNDQLKDLLYMSFKEVIV